MKGLLLKDLLSFRGQLKIIALLLVFFTVMARMSGNIVFSGAFMMMIGITYVLGTFTYDEQYRWDKFVLALPVSRAQVVVSKYIAALLWSVATALASWLLTAAGAGVPLNALAILVTGGGALLLLSVVLPLTYRFGVQRARIVIMALVFGFAFLLPLSVRFTALGPLLDSMGEQALVAGVQTAGVAVGAVALPVFALSALLSIWIYRRKELS